MLYIGIDLGTSAVKLLLMDETGDIKKVGKNVFMCAPNNVSVNFTEELKKPSSSTTMPWEE